MKTGMIRQVDPLGRIVLPIELRRALGIQTRDMVEIMVEGNTFVLRKVESACHFCGSTEGLTSFREKQICIRCLRQLRTL